MAVKPLTVAISIGGIALLLVGASAIKSRVAYSNDGREITRLIAEYKAMGVPTNGTEYFHKIPDSENAWIELEPLLFQKGPSGSHKGLFKSRLSSQFISVGTKADLPLMRKYLETNREKRAKIAEIIRRKPKIQVPHDYDEGWQMLQSELATIQDIGREFSLSALEHAMASEYNQVIPDLEIAAKFSNYAVERGEWISTIIGLDIRSRCNTACLRIVEIVPNLSDSIHDFMLSPGRFVQPNFQSVFEAAFLEQISNCRYFDTPRMDKREPPFPLSLLSGSDDRDSNEKALEGGSTKHGDYLPKSHAMRAYLRAKLNAWKPFLTKLMSAKDPNYVPQFSDYEPISKANEKAPPEFSKTLGLEVIGAGDDQAFEPFWKPKEYAQSERIVWTAIYVHHKTGHYPATLEAFNAKTDAFTRLGGLAYSVSDQGFLLTSKKLRDDSQPQFKIAYPTSLMMKPSTGQDYKKAISDYKSGKIDRDKNDLILKTP